MRRAQKRRNYRNRKRLREEAALLAGIGSESKPTEELLKYARLWFDQVLGRKPLVQEVDRINWRELLPLDGVIAFQFFEATSGGSDAERVVPTCYVGAEQLDFKTASKLHGRKAAISAWTELQISRERALAVRLEDGSWRVAFISDVHYDRDGKGGLHLRRPFGAELAQSKEPVKTAEAFASA